MSGSSIDEELASLWRGAWATAEREAFAACCGARVHYEDPLTTEPLEGLDALAEHAGRYREAFPDLRLEPSGQPVVQERFACVPWRLAGTHRGALGGLPASGRFVAVEGLHYLELADGRVGRARGFFDLYDVAVQLGLLPARGSLAETALLLVRGFGLRGLRQRA
ncbi:MAG: ester cyclase [Actinobacteria bacterium]|nr:ester cyclase [Actinomycetota bacterium]